MRRGGDSLRRRGKNAARAVRSALDGEIRQMIRRERARAGGAPFRAPEMRRVEDADERFVRVEVGDSVYWEPRSIDVAMLGSIYEEVFGERHPHHYEFEGCRVREGDVVVDAGACEGFFTRFALDRGARVIAVEPWSVQAEALRKTFAAEIAEDRVRVAQLALSDREGTLELRIDPENPWGAGLGWAYKATLSEEVRLTTLDRLAAETWGRCDFLKADIEGAEVGMIDGSLATLRRDRPRVSIAVYHHPDGYFDIRRRIATLGLGYRVAAKGVAAGTRDRPMLLHAWVPPAE